MRILTKDEIVKVNDSKRVEVETPEWGEGTGVYVKMMTGTQRDEYEADIVTTRGKDVQVNLKNLKLKLCVLTMVNEDNTRMFEDELDKKENIIKSAIEQLGEKACAPIDRVFAASQKLNRLSKEDVEDLTKN